MNFKILPVYMSLFILFSSCAAGRVVTDKIKVPEKFKVELYADGVENIRAMAAGDSGVIFAGSMGAGKVYAVVDKDGDKKADETVIIAEGLTMPVGVALYNGDLYVSAVSRIIRFKDIENTFRNRPAYEVVYDKFPDDHWHGWKFIRFGPDKKLYVPVGAPCNVCLRGEKVYSSITRMNSDGSNFEIFAEGIRNTVGFDWQPGSGVLWFTENGRDLMGDDIPPDELNKAPKKGMHFGFPYYHGIGIPDPVYSKKYSKNIALTEPEAEFGAHTACLGMRFYTGKMFPGKYEDGIFVAQHGSWNRSSKTGYRVVFVGIKDGKTQKPEVFADGWMKDEKVYGRPVDIEFLKDGSMLVSDDKAGAIYRISYGD